MKSYRFRVELEAEEDGWFVRCPTLERYGGVAWGGTEEEAHRRIREVLGLVVASMVELGMPVPEGMMVQIPLRIAGGMFQYGLN